MELTEQELSSEVILEGGFITLRRDRVRLPDGKEATREYVEHPGAVAVLALTDADELVMERQYRYPLRREFLEIPAGKRDAGEAPEVTARRELLEETGYTARKWRFLGTAFPCIGYADEAIHYFLATGLTQQERALDDGEFLEVLVVPLKKAQAMALSGEVCDSKSIVGLHWLAAHQNGMLPGVPV
ncbi:NUDIX domain-containing protein [Crenobacter cavernae]|uniref:GDP-mannose pyrophosphatase n=1 Tax=Crenobacter cavernae TaxID=2290923 RepID=A0ABY0FB04_9NEIS|nr:NUDIX hydrolase [Crenobacter cavernae]RXZ42821.1 NUDIX hydrolase [Crenobacter cavernae]